MSNNKYEFMRFCYFTYIDIPQFKLGPKESGIVTTLFHVVILMRQRIY